MKAGSNIDPAFCCSMSCLIKSDNLFRAITYLTNLFAPEEQHVYSLRRERNRAPAERNVSEAMSNRDAEQKHDTLHTCGVRAWFATLL